MILNELFDRPPELRSIDSDETEARFSIRTVAAYEAHIDSEPYVFMVEDVDHQGGWFSFGKVVERDGVETVDYTPTNEKRPYPVLAAAVEVIRRYLTDDQPYLMRLKGHVPAQNRLYSAMVKMLRPRLPSVYEVTRDDDADWWEIKRTDLYEARIPRLTFNDARDFIADLDTGQGRIKAVVERNQWLRALSQDAARAQLGSRFAVYRAVTLTNKLRPDGIASTTLDPKVAVSILHQAPGVIFAGTKVIKTKHTLLRYDITPANVVAWVPAIIDVVKAGLGKRTNATIEDRYGERKKIARLLQLHAEQDEKEIVADLTGLKPKVMRDLDGADLFAMSWLLRGVDDQTIKNSWRHDDAALAKLRAFFV